MNWGCVILAGDDGVPIAPGLPAKPLIEFGGIASVVRVHNAVSAIGPVVTVGVPEVAALVPVEGFVLQGRGAMENMKLGLDALPNCDAVLLIPSDSPFITEQCVRDFCKRIESAATRPDWLATSGCLLDQFVAKYPSVPCSGVPLKEGKLVGSGLYACSPAVFAVAEPIVRELRANRKSQVKMALKFGFGNTLKMLMGRMDIASAQEMLTRLSGAQILLDTDASPESCLDFDDEADLNALLKLPL